MKDFEDKVISKLTCDACSKQATRSDSEFHEFISVNHLCAQASIHIMVNKLVLIYVSSASLICVVIV